MFPARRLAITLFAVSSLLSGLPAAHAAEAPLLELDAGSSKLEVAVKATMDSFVAHLEKYQATIHGEAASHRLTDATVVFAWSDLRTGKADRDKQMNAWQNSTAYSEGRFTLTSLSPADATGAQQASGTLEFHGQSHPITFPITTQWQGNSLTIDGDAPVDVRTYGLTPIRKMGVFKVDPVVHVRFHLAGKLPAAN